jgi:hypothetical protein
MNGKKRGSLADEWKFFQLLFKIQKQNIKISHDIFHPRMCFAVTVRERLAAKLDECIEQKT